MSPAKVCAACARLPSVESLASDRSPAHCASDASRYATARASSLVADTRPAYMASTTWFFR